MIYLGSTPYFDNAYEEASSSTATNRVLVIPGVTDITSILNVPLNIVSSAIGEETCTIQVCSSTSTSGVIGTYDLYVPNISVSSTVSTGYFSRFYYGWVLKNQMYTIMLVKGANYGGDYRFILCTAPNFNYANLHNYLESIYCSFITNNVADKTNITDSKIYSADDFDNISTSTYLIIPLGTDGTSYTASIINLQYDSGTVTDSDSITHNIYNLTISYYNNNNVLSTFNISYDLYESKVYVGKYGSFDESDYTSNYN